MARARAWREWANRRRATEQQFKIIVVGVYASKVLDVVDVLIVLDVVDALIVLDAVEVLIVLDVVEALIVLDAVEALIVLVVAYFRRR